MDWSAFAIACTLLFFAGVALVAEIFLVSFGALALISLGLAIAAMIYAFSASMAVGWTFVVVAPLLGSVILSFGLKALQRSRLVPKAEIDGDAGYHVTVNALGIIVGSAGTLVTAARPTARARFAGGECDVHCDRSAEAGATVAVTAISGPTVFVTLTNP